MKVQTVTHCHDLEYYSSTVVVLGFTVQSSSIGVPAIKRHALLRSFVVPQARSRLVGCSYSGTIAAEKGAAAPHVYPYRIGACVSSEGLVRTGSYAFIRKHPVEETRQ